ncbi:SDR family NAD(P)-dependent oxidoreductase [Mycobacterium sp. NPDC003323]
MNLWGVVNGCNIFLPILAEQPEACIINTASTAGFLTTAPLHPYAATKAAVVALSETMAHEFATEYPHIGVAVLCPAYNATAIRDDERNAPPDHTPRSVADPQSEDLRGSVNASIDEGVTTEFVADLVARAMTERRTHIFPSPEWLQFWRDQVERVAAQVAATRLNEFGALTRAELR